MIEGQMGVFILPLKFFIERVFNLKISYNKFFESTNQYLRLMQDN